jgi:hypothetical protein
MTAKHEVSATFAREDATAVAAIDRRLSDRGRARELSPALLPSIDQDLKLLRGELKKAREAAALYDLERVELARATARRQAAHTRLNTSTEVDDSVAREIVAEADAARYLETARSRRLEAAKTAADSAYGRCAKDLAARRAAVSFAETLAGAVLNHEESRAPIPDRADVLAWLPLTLPAEGRTFFESSAARRAHNPSYAGTPGIAEFDAACARVFAHIERLREQAQQRAEEFARLGGTQA